MVRLVLYRHGYPNADLLDQEDLPSTDDATTIPLTAEGEAALAAGEEEGDVIFGTDSKGK